MLELKGEFVSYIAGVKTSSLSRGLAGNLKVLSCSSKSYCRATGKISESKCSSILAIEVQHLKTQKQGAKYVSQTNHILCRSDWPLGCHLKNMVTDQISQLLRMGNQTADSTDSRLPSDFPNHLPLSVRWGYVVFLFDFAIRLFSEHNKMASLMIKIRSVDIEGTSAKCQHLYYSSCFRSPPVLQH